MWRVRDFQKPNLCPNVTLQESQQLTECRKMMIEVILEPGLDGTGPRPIHLHRGNPTPWSEGCVFRILSDTSESWLANAQTGFGYATSATIWKEAESVILIAMGATYFVNLQVPNVWKYISDTGTSCTISPDGIMVLICTYFDIVAIDHKGNELWKREVAIDGVEILNIENGLIYGNACIDPPDEWQSFTLRLDDGKEVE
ncbi:MAG: hypothetical protein KDA78_16365 [Planctomycetaceae bacterium]|nr:hypothetical protein [Planctomycetaceae bacterium]